jgi:hypothetical protein
MYLMLKISKNVRGKKLGHHTVLHRKVHQFFCIITGENCLFYVQKKPGKIRAKRVAGAH